MRVPALAFTLLSFALPAAAQSFQASKLPAASRDSFDVIYQGQPIGTFVMNLAKNGDKFAFTGDANLLAMGMQSLDSLVFDATTLAPVRATNQISMQGTSAVSFADFAGGKVTGTAQRPGPGGIQTSPVNATIAAGVIGDGAEVILIPTLDLAEGMAMSFQTFDGKSGQTKTYQMKVVGKENITIPLGTFETYKVQLVSDESATVYVTTTAPRRVMMLRLEAQGVEMRRAK